MQREDVERRKVDTSREAVERIASFCEQFSLNIPATLRALLAERDAARALSDELDFLHHEGGDESIAREIERARNEAFAAGQEEMRDRAVAVSRARKVEITDNYTGGWTTCAVRILDELQSLPIKPMTHCAVLAAAPDLLSGCRAALDEIDRLTAALAEAEDRGAAQMRERAAEAVLYLARMKGMGERTIDAPEAAHLIRALPLREPGAAP